MKFPGEAHHDSLFLQYWNDETAENLSVTVVEAVRQSAIVEQASPELPVKNRLE